MTLSQNVQDIVSGGDFSRPVRADARRNVSALLDAALAVFTTSGVDAPVREIADKAGVGVGTLYRHFPQRTDLVVAVFHKEVDACAEAASLMSAQFEPAEALDRWLHRYIDFIGTKRGLALALQPGNPIFEKLALYLQDRLRPALSNLLVNAAQAGRVRRDVDPSELLMAIAHLCSSTGSEGVTEQSRRMVQLLIDGLRHGASDKKSH